MTAQGCTDPAVDRVGERGNATVLTAIGGAAMLALLIIALQIGGGMVARHRAESAADLAALAGAAQLLSGSDSACGSARAIAAENGAQVVSCEVVGEDLRIVVILPIRIGPLGSVAGGRARAGPVAGILGGGGGSSGHS